MIKCYKLHGYPPGYKSKIVNISAAINQVYQASEATNEFPHIPFTQEQCKQLLDLFSSNNTNEVPSDNNIADNKLHQSLYNLSGTSLSTTYIQNSLPNTKNFIP